MSCRVSANRNSGNELLLLLLTGLQQQQLLLLVLLLGSLQWLLCLLQHRQRHHRKILGAFELLQLCCRNSNCDSKVPRSVLLLPLLDAVLLRPSSVRVLGRHRGCCRRCCCCCHCCCCCFSCCCCRRPPQYFCIPSFWGCCKWRRGVCLQRQLLLWLSLLQLLRIQLLLPQLNFSVKREILLLLLR